MTWSPDETYVAVTARKFNNPYFKSLLDLNEEVSSTLFEKSLSFEHSLLNVAQIEAVKTMELTLLKPLLDHGTPLGGITALSVAFLRNLVATIGKDLVIRIWAFDTFRQLVTLQQNEVTNDIALHPMGLQLAIVTKEGYIYIYILLYRLKIFYLLEECLKLAFEFSGKASFAVEYSHGGQWLAAGIYIYIYIYI